MRYILFVLVLCLGFVSAGFELGGSCDEIVSAFEDMDEEFVIPSGIPFGDDILDIYVDEGFVVSFELVEKKLTGVSCEVSEDVDYNVYISEELAGDISEGNLVMSVDLYNEMKDSGDLEIDAVGFGKSVKLGLVNFGLWVAGWFA
ncbi:hypothetical protein HN903_04495 [archaeon]|nr:hypothetical protein [archaeon]MBT7128987.1 hypothetical protein [archaeon]